MRPAAAVPVSVPAISVTYAAPPALVSAGANPEHVGCTAEELDRVLRAMASIPEHRASLVRKPGRGLRYAAPPDAVLRYLRAWAPVCADDGGGGEGTVMVEAKAMVGG